MTPSPLTPEALRAAFDAPAPLTVGLEEELMLLDPESGDLTPRARELLARTDGDPRFKLELPAAQIEIVLPPLQSVGAALGELARARRDLAGAATGIASLAAAGAHPFAAAEGELNRGERYDRTAAAHGAFARRQLVFALQVHVAVGSADAALAVYNALRSYLPEIAALAANAPFHEGRDTGLASIRPKIAEALPRQGIPPAVSSWDAYAEALAWGASSATVVEPAVWWWELRPHPGFGTLELRVPDAQATLADAAGVAAFCHALTGWLVERAAAGEQLAVADSWRIAENRWLAARDGVEGELADLETGERRPTQARLESLLDTLGPVAERLGCAAELEEARRLARENGAMRQRAVAAAAGVGALPRWLAERFLDPPA